MNSTNGMLPASNSTTAAQTPSLKTYFKSPEGRYKLHFEKTHQSGFLQYAHGKTVTQVTLANLKEKPAPSTPSAPSSTFSAASGVRSAAARLLGATNGSRALGFVGGNGGNKSSNSGSRMGSLSPSSSSNSVANGNFDGKGTYLICNSGDAVFISDFNSQDKDPIKSIQFNNSIPVCHAFDQDAKDGHDLLIGLNTGDVYSVSLRQQLQDTGKRLVGAQHYNKDGSITTSRCTSIAWVPGGDGSFVVAHADGNLYAYEKNKDGTVDSSFPAIKDVTQFSVVHARYSKSNPIARWHICQFSINGIAFSCDGAHLAVVGRDGYLRVFDYSNEQLIYGGKGYYGALLCCTWSKDGKYILTGGEDDLVHVWSMEDRRIIAWGEGHNSWVSGVAFDSYWSTPSHDGGTAETTIYRFGSVGQDTQLILWDLETDEIVVSLRKCFPGGSPMMNGGNQSSHWENTVPVGTLQPSPRMRDTPKLSPLAVHNVDTEPLTGLVFTQDSITTACREGHIKIWSRPATSESQPSATNMCKNLHSNAKQG